MGHGGEFVSLRRELFGEGISILGARLYQLTWRENVVLVYDISTEDSWRTKPPEEIRLPSPIKEGWGLAHTGDNKWLLLSDGSDHIYWINPEGFTVEKTTTIQSYGSNPKRIQK